MKSLPYTHTAFHVVVLLTATAITTALICPRLCHAPRTQVLNDVPFSIPPYFALLARAIVTLEGIALTGDPNYGIILESYPFVARKLLSEDRPEIQKALQGTL